MNRPHYFCHLSLMVLSTAALAAQAPATMQVQDAAPTATSPAPLQASPAAA